MKITNVRPYTLHIEGQACKPGDSIDVPDAIGLAAVKQPANWRKTRAPKPPTPHTDQTVKES